MALCSESRGMICLRCFFNCGPAATTVSLFARRRVFLALRAAREGRRPARPEMRFKMRSASLSLARERMANVVVAVLETLNCLACFFSREAFL